MLGAASRSCRCGDTICGLVPQRHPPSWVRLRTARSLPPRQDRVAQIAGQMARHAIVLEADAPAFWPIIQMPPPCQLRRLELLADLVLPHRRLGVGQISIEDVSVLAYSIAEDAGIADAVQETVPRRVDAAQRFRTKQVVVANDEEIARKIEEGRQIVHHDQIKVQKQCSMPRKPTQVSPEQAKLAPSQIAVPFRQAQFGQGHRLDPRCQSLDIVGKADEPMPTRQVAAYLCRQPVHILSTVKRAPFHRQDQDRIVHYVVHMP